MNNICRLLYKKNLVHQEPLKINFPKNSAQQKSAI